MVLIKGTKNENRLASFYERGNGCKISSRGKKYRASKTKKPLTHFKISQERYLPVKFVCYTLRNYFK